MEEEREDSTRASRPAIEKPSLTVQLAYKKLFLLLLATS